MIQKKNIINLALSICFNSHQHKCLEWSNKCSNPAFYRRKTQLLILFHWIRLNRRTCDTQRACVCVLWSCTEYNFDSDCNYVRISVFGARVWTYGMLKSNCVSSINFSSVLRMIVHDLVAMCTHTKHTSLPLTLVSRFNCDSIYSFWFRFRTEYPFESKCDKRENFFIKKSKLLVQSNWQWMNWNRVEWIRKPKPKTNKKKIVSKCAIQWAVEVQANLYTLETFHRNRLIITTSKRREWVEWMCVDCFYFARDTFQIIVK